MKITIPTFHEVTLNDSICDDITKRRLKVLLKGGEYLRYKKDTRWVCQDDPHWRHGSISEEYMREASELDLAIFTVLKALDGNKL
jgi:hypothetical protein